MNKKDVVESISERTNVAPETVSHVLEAYALTVKSMLKNGHRVDFRGFGNFFLKKRAAKKARVITRAEQILVPEHMIVCFRPSNELKEEIKKIKPVLQPENE